MGYTNNVKLVILAVVTFNFLVKIGGKKCLANYYFNDFNNLLKLQILVVTNRELLLKHEVGLSDKNTHQHIPLRSPKGSH